MSGPIHDSDREALSLVRALAEQAFSRAAGAPLVEGNSIGLLKNAEENYPAWLDAIRRAKHTCRSDSSDDEAAVAPSSH